MITIPTISELYTQIKSDLEATYSSQIPAFGKNFLRVMASVQAGKLWLIYKAVGYVQKNVFPDLADPESTGGTLERFGRIKLNRNPFVARAGQYITQVTGTVGATIQAKTTFKSDDDSVSPGKLFVIDNDFTLITSPDEITLRALEPGLDSQLDAGDGLTATIPLDSVNEGVTIVSEYIAPLAAEDTEEYRQKILDSFRTEPQGGAATDYRIWAADAQGVERVYPYTAYGGENEVDVYVEATTDDSTDGKGTPSAAIITEVEEVIDFDPDDSVALNERGRRPINVIVNVIAITPLDVDIVIDGYENLDATIQTSIENALEELTDAIRPFIAGADVLADRNDRLDLNRIVSKIYEAVPGSTFGDVTLEVDGSIVTSYTFENGDIPYMNSVTYT
jgi:uncharacterized phage protein gp47/JayE